MAIRQEFYVSSFELDHCEELEISAVEQASEQISETREALTDDRMITIREIEHIKWILLSGWLNTDDLYSMLSDRRISIITIHKIPNASSSQAFDVLRFCHVSRIFSCISGTPLQQQAKTARAKVEGERGRPVKEKQVTSVSVLIEC